MIVIYLILGFLLSGALFFNRKNQLNILLVISFMLLQWAFTIYECLNKNRTDFDYFQADALGLILLITLSIIFIPAVYHSFKYLSIHKDSLKNRAIYFSALTFLILSITAAYLSNHIAVTWIFVELTTLSVTVLIYHHRNNTSLEGTWKYLFICAVSISFVFIGILFLSLASSGELSFASMISKANELDLFWTKLAFIFIFTGFTVKLGLVPMYTAGIDAKDIAPAPIAALLSTVLCNVGFVGIFRFYAVVAHTSLFIWANQIIIIAAVLSIFVATVYMLKVKNIKRMLAYSGIEQMGLVMLGLAAGGIGYYAAILHIVLHSFVKSSLFFQLSQVFRIFQSKSIYKTGYYFKYNITGAIVLLLGFFCITAMPPSGLFISEFLIFRSLFEANYIILLIFILMLITIIIWSLAKNFFKILFLPAINFDESKAIKISSFESLSQFILLGLSIFLGINPPTEFINIINEAIKVLP